MSQRSVSLPALLLLGTLAFGAPPSLPAAPAAEHDDCDSGFLVFQGAEAYQFSPRHAGELGSVRLFGLLSFQGAAVRGEAGVAYWQLAIDGPGEEGGVGRDRDGELHIRVCGAALGSVGGSGGTSSWIVLSVLAQRSEHGSGETWQTVRFTGPCPAQSRRKL